MVKKMSDQARQYSLGDKVYDHQVMRLVFLYGSNGSVEFQKRNFRLFARKNARTQKNYFKRKSIHLHLFLKQQIFFKLPLKLSNT